MEKTDALLLSLAAMFLGCVQTHICEAQGGEVKGILLGQGAMVDEAVPSPSLYPTLNPKVKRCTAVTWAARIMFVVADVRSLNDPKMLCVVFAMGRDLTECLSRPHPVCGV